MYQTMNTEPAPPGTLNPEVPAMLNFIITKALAKGVDDRYQNAKEFADDLRACRDALPRSTMKTESVKVPSASGTVLPDAIPAAQTN